MIRRLAKDVFVLLLVSISIRREFEAPIKNNSELCVGITMFRLACIETNTKIIATSSGSYSLLLFETSINEDSVKHQK